GRNSPLDDADAEEDGLVADLHGNRREAVDARRLEMRRALVVDEIRDAADDREADDDDERHEHAMKIRALFVERGDELIDARFDPFEIAARRRAGNIRRLRDTRCSRIAGRVLA